MHATVSSPHYEQALHQIALLTLEEKFRLLGEISSALRKNIPMTTADATPTRAEIVRNVKGKYAHVSTGSALFAQNKLQELEWER